MLTLIDTHAHLQEIEDLKGALSRAEDAGVKAIITVSMDYQSSNRAMEISGRYGGTVVYPALGIHPWRIEPSLWIRQSDLLKRMQGRQLPLERLDLISGSKAQERIREREIQREVFRRLLELARRHSKPAIIHARGAWNDCYQVAREVKVQRAVFHWYSGPVELLVQVSRYAAGLVFIDHYCLIE